MSKARLQSAKKALGVQGTQKASAAVLHFSKTSDKGDNTGCHCKTKRCLLQSWDCESLRRSLAEFGNLAYKGLQSVLCFHASSLLFYGRKRGLRPPMLRRSLSLSLSLLLQALYSPLTGESGLHPEPDGPLVCCAGPAWSSPEIDTDPPVKGQLVGSISLPSKPTLKRSFDSNLVTHNSAQQLRNVHVRWQGQICPYILQPQRGA